MPSNRPSRALAACLVLILLFAALPVISVLISSGLATAFRCPLDEGGTHPCPFLGTDLGGLLSVLFVSGWLAVLTIPIGVVLLLFWSIAAAVLAARHRRAR